MTPAEALNPRRRNMQANRRRDTGPERALRSILHASGLRYRCDFRILLDRRSVRPDIVFTRRRIAVFVDGCFWHQCPLHSRPPARNVAYWGPKLERNRARDQQNTADLEAAGWVVLRFWEHESPHSAAEKILASYVDAGGHVPVDAGGHARFEGGPII